MPVFVWTEVFIFRFLCICVRDIYLILIKIMINTNDDIKYILAAKPKNMRVEEHQNEPVRNMSSECNLYTLVNRCHSEMRLWICLNQYFFSFISFIFFFINHAVQYSTFTFDQGLSGYIYSKYIVRLIYTCY